MIIDVHHTCMCYYNEVICRTIPTSSRVLDAVEKFKLTCVISNRCAHALTRHINIHRHSCSPSAVEIVSCSRLWWSLARDRCEKGLSVESDCRLHWIDGNTYYILLEPIKIRTKQKDPDVVQTINKNFDSNSKIEINHCKTYH